MLAIGNPQIYSRSKANSTESGWEAPSACCRHQAHRLTTSLPVKTRRTSNAEESFAMVGRRFSGAVARRRCLPVHAVNQDIDEHFAGTCTNLDLPGSGEDMHVDSERGFVYLSVFDRMAGAKGETPESGRIMRVNLQAPVLQAEDALVNAPDYIRPHGISIYIDPEGQRHSVRDKSSC